MLGCKLLCDNSIVLWGLKATFEFNEYFGWVIFVFFQEKDIHVTMPLDLKSRLSKNTGLHRETVVF